MRKIAPIGLVSLASLLLVTPPALASHWGHGSGRFHHRHTGVFFGLHLFAPLYPPWYVVPYPYSPYPYYGAPPTVYSYAPPPQAPTAIGYLRLNVYPTEAHIYVDGRYLGPVQQFPEGAVAIPPGPHQVAVVAWGHRPFQSEVQTTQGQTSTLSVVLERDRTAPMGPPIPPGAPHGEEIR